MVAKSYSQPFYFFNNMSPCKLKRSVCPTCTTVGGTTDDFIRQKLAERDSRNMRIGVWKRLEDEMPPQGASFLGWLNSMKIPIICSCFNIPNDRIGHELGDDYRDIKNRGVTHWMKLPDPPVD